MAFSHIRNDVSSNQAIYQSSKKTDFTVDLIWWAINDFVVLNLLKIVIKYCNDFQVIHGTINIFSNFKAIQYVHLYM